MEVGQVRGQEPGREELDQPEPFGPENQAQAPCAHS